MAANQIDNSERWLLPRMPSALRERHLPDETALGQLRQAGLDGLGIHYAGIEPLTNDRFW